jgi:hypothetical protein
MKARLMVLSVNAALVLAAVAGLWRFKATWSDGTGW